MTQIPAYLNTATTQTPHPTVTASVDGPVGYASLELAVLACPRSTRCLYVIKTLDVWKIQVTGLLVESSDKNTLVL